MKRLMNVSLGRNGAPPPFRLSLHNLYVSTLFVRDKPFLNAVTLAPFTDDGKLIIKHSLLQIYSVFCNGYDHHSLFIDVTANLS